MPRLNVEDAWFIDVLRRRAKLIKILESTETESDAIFRADGMALAAWRLAQDYANHPAGLVPLEEWPADLDAFIAAGLAERRPEGVHVRGAGKQFKWLMSRSEAGSSGGKSSGETRRAKQRSKPKQTAKQRSKPKQNVKNGEATKPLPLTHSPTQEQNPLYPPQAGEQKKRKREPRRRGLCDEAARITEAVISIVLNPPLGMPLDEALADIRRRVPEIGRRVVERRVGEGGWPMFVGDAQSANRNGFMPAFHKQLREAILAELRANPSEGDA